MQALATPSFRLYGNDDPVGAEVGGAAKNVVAIGAGAVIGAGLGGHHNAQRQTWGHSQIIDPWGRVLAERTEDGPGVVLASRSPGEQEDIRRRMPVGSHRRL